jgi:RNA polymerase sigma factor (sigma-70 family)
VSLTTNAKLARFERIVMPHLNAAYNLARWLLRNEPDAEDVVQEAYLRALRYFEGFSGEDGRAWLLAIVRNTCRTHQKRAAGASMEFDEEKHSDIEGSSTEEHLVKQTDIDSVRWCIDGLPVEYREVVVLRELEEFSYREIAAAISAPLGTVMSRLARARARLLECLTARVRRVPV